MDMEVRYVWRSPRASRKLSRLLYIYNRYMSILWNLLNLELIGTISDTVSATCGRCLTDALSIGRILSRGKDLYLHVHILRAPDAVPPSSCTALYWLGAVLDYCTCPTNPAGHRSQGPPPPRILAVVPGHSGFRRSRPYFCGRSHPKIAPPAALRGNRAALWYGQSQSRPGAPLFAVAPLRDPRSHPKPPAGLVGQVQYLTMLGPAGK